MAKSTNGVNAADKAQDLTEDLVTLDNVDEADGNDNNHDIGTPRQEPSAENGSLPSNTYDASVNLPPWMTSFVDYRRTNHMVALHNEIVQFCKLMEPLDEELEERQKLVDRFKTLVHSVFKDCQVDLFGSQVTGLCLPTSDIDIAIQLSEADTPKTEEEEKVEAGKSKKNAKEQELNEMENWDAPTLGPLRRLGNALREKWIDELSYLEVIENTRVPLVKFTHGPSNISVDVCFNQSTGPQAAKLMHQYMDALPPLRPLTFVLKYYTASRSLNQPYTGGIGSFMLQMMIVTFLQHRERDGRASRLPIVNNLGALLIEFLEFYSMDFNFITTGVSVRFDGYFFPKGACIYYLWCFSVACASVY
jgi:non-canonical poly(A) RNA polymerase PAPD5/7